MTSDSPGGSAVPGTSNIKAWDANECLKEILTTYDSRTLRTNEKLMFCLNTQIYTFVSKVSVRVASDGLWH